MIKMYFGKVLNKLNNKPIEGVSVTDGLNVTKTDEKGEFTLKGNKKCSFIYVTIPSNYKTDYFYIPVSQRESYDFYLEETNADLKNHCFIQVSDTEIGEKSNMDWLSYIKEGVMRENASFIIHTGDICYTYGLKHHIEYMNEGTMGCPVKYAIGNHDFVEGAYGEELYEKIYGPTFYSFDVGDIHYIVTPISRGLDNKSRYTEKEIYTWVKNDIDNMENGKSIIIFNHTKSINDNYIFFSGKDEFDLKEKGLVGWFFGHYHYNMLYKNKNVLNCSAPRPDCGGIDSSPAGYRVIYVKGKELSTKMCWYDLGKSGEPKKDCWHKKLEGNILFCNTLLDGNNIYTATANDDYPSNCGIYCLSDEGEIKWFYKTSNSIKNNVSLKDNKLFAITCEGEVLCLNNETGSLLWRRNLKFKNNTLGTSSQVKVVDNFLITGSATDVYSLNSDNGEILWENHLERGENSPAEYEVVGDLVFVSSHWSSLTAINIKNGKIKWQINDSKMRFRTASPTKMDDKKILAFGSDSVDEILVENGKILSETTFEGVDFSSSGKITLNGDIAYISTSNKGLIAFSIKDKKFLWSFEPEDNILFSSPYSRKGNKTVEGSVVVYKDKLIFGANDGYLYILNSSGEILKKYFVGSAVLNTPAIKNDKIYVGSFNGMILCYKL